MRLIALEAYGFKSFADKIRLTFDKGMTAIVGPNGSGKSNITDAVRWVLGEGKKGLLRLSKAEDVIFSGTPKRRALGVAEVSLTFLNEGDLSVDYREVVITRRLYRSGESEFFINRSNCRLKDILSLFADTGIGADSMSIIGQNRIDDILSGKPEDTRAFFEEAAGISKYRIKKEESIRKLDATEKNLARLSDIELEIENSLAPLEEAAKKKKEFDALSRELFKYRLTELYLKYDRARSVRQNFEKECEELKVKQTSLDALILESENKRLLIEQNAQNAEKELEEFTNQIDAINKEITVIEKEISTLTERANNKEETRAKILEQRERLNQNKDKLEADCANAKTEIANNEREQNSIRATISEKEDVYKAKLSEFQKLNGDGNELKAKNDEILNIRAAVSEITQNISTAKEKISFLERLQEDYEGFNYAAKAVLKSKEDFSRGVLGAAIELIDAPKKYAVAVEVALGAAAQNIVVEDEQTAKAAIEFLKRNSYGRATFLPLSTVTVKENREEKTAKFDFVIGTLDTLVNYEPRYQKLAKFLLGRTVLVDNFDNAMVLARATNFTKRIVTLDGSLVLPGGSITGGSVKSKRVGFLDRKRELSELQIDVKNLAAKKEEKLSLLETKEAEFETFEADFNDAKEKLNELLNKLKEEIQNKNTESLLLAQAAQHARENEIRIKAEIDAAIKEIEQNKKEEESLESVDTPERLTEQMALRNAKNFERLELERKKDARYGDRLAATADIKEQEKNIRNMNGEKERLKEEVHKKELAMSRESAVMEETAAELQKNFDLTPKAAESEIVEGNAGNIDDKVKTLTYSIEELGDINHAAVREYEELKKRYDELGAQMTDIIRAREDLKLLIANIENDMTERFKSAFAEIEKYFDDIFKRLFGGGRAALRLIDPNDVLNTGVIIIAELPNKKRQNLFALSGGERALTVIALLFALLAYKPSPFCVLDEIDAPLDEANLGRFSAFLKEYGEETQFIVVTHRKTTMEAADVMYGVTASEGVSQVLSVRI
ncbi:MAG: AAA family ATPase [Selenomonadaceae bacterium]|nr:AAA family ATPase [Selenomonadaceae bacterium]